MSIHSDTTFPEDFGKSPDDFLQTYARLIYKIIYENTVNDPRLEIEDVFNDFFIHISRDNFKKLRQYTGKCKTTTYIGKVLRNFILDQKKKKGFTTSSLEEIGDSVDISILPEQEDKLIIREVIREAFKETFSRFSSRQRLIFHLTYSKEKSAKEISDLLKIKEQDVYESNRRGKKILKDELEARGMIIK
ncbi:MAG: RNA polymerase sigma factor [bacterium]